MKTYTKAEQKILMNTLGDWENSETLYEWIDFWECEVDIAEHGIGYASRDFTFEVLLQYLNDTFENVEDLIEETLQQNS